MSSNIYPLSFSKLSKPTQSQNPNSHSAPSSWCTSVLLHVVLHELIHNISANCIFNLPLFDYACELIITGLKTTSSISPYESHHSQKPTRRSAPSKPRKKSHHTIFIKLVLLPEPVFVLIIHDLTSNLGDPLWYQLLVQMRRRKISTESKTHKIC